MFDPLIVWGAGGHGRVVAEIVRRGSAYRVIAFIDDKSGELGAAPEPGVTIWRRLEDAVAKFGGPTSVHVAIGDNAARREICGRVGAGPIQLATLIDPLAQVSADAKVGTGTLVTALSRIGSSARVGSGVIVNTGAIVEHDCTVSDYAHIAPRVVIGGGTSVGDETLIGIGATVLGGLIIGRRVIVGAGAVVLSDLPDGAVAYGCPARIMRIQE